MEQKTEKRHELPPKLIEKLRARFDDPHEAASALWISDKQYQRWLSNGFNREEHLNRAILLISCVLDLRFDPEWVIRYRDSMTN